METKIMGGTLYNSILVGYDESISSKAALAEASHWVKKHGGNVVLVHAVHFDEEQPKIAPTQRDKRLKLGEKSVTRQRKPLLPHSG